jgi:hypothetical protein
MISAITALTEELRERLVLEDLHRPVIYSPLNPFDLVLRKDSKVEFTHQRVRSPGSHPT